MLNLEKIKFALKIKIGGTLRVAKKIVLVDFFVVVKNHKKSMYEFNSETVFISYLLNFFVLLSSEFWEAT